MPSWRDGVDEFEQVIAGEAPAFQEVKRAYERCILPLHEQHPAQPEDARREIEEEALARLRRFGHRNALTFYYCLPAYAVLLLRNRAYWESPDSQPIPSPELMARLLEARALAAMQIDNPYGGILSGIESFIAGLPEQASRQFHDAQRQPCFSQVVCDSLRGASTMRPMPGPHALIHSNQSIAKGRVHLMRKAALLPELPVLSFSADDVYFRAFALSIIESLAKHVRSGANVHFHVINYAHETSASAVQILERVCEDSGFRLLITTETNRTASRTYFATSRFARAREFLRLFERDIVISDADVEFVGNPYETLAKRDHGTIGILSSRGPYWGFLPWRNVWAGHVYFPFNEAGTRFADLLSSAVAWLWREEQHLSWWVDQSALWLARRTLIELGGARSFSEVHDVGRYIVSGEGLKIAGLKRIQEISEAMEAGKSWHTALLSAQQG